MRICVFGASSDNIDNEYIQQSEQLGRLFKENELELVYGGGAHGLMGAIARGVKEKGGVVIGISPKMFDVEGVLFDDADEMIITENLFDRKIRMLEDSEGFICLPGGVGTFDEFFEIYAQSQLEYYRKPIVLFNINDFYTPLYDFIIKAHKEGFISSKSVQLFKIANTPQEVIDSIK